MTVEARWLGKPVRFPIPNRYWMGAAILVALALGAAAFLLVRGRRHPVATIFFTTI